MKVFNLLKHLSPKHRCDLICFGAESPEATSGLRAALPRVGAVTVFPPRLGISRWLWVLWKLLRIDPPSLARFARRELHQLLSEELANGAYDVVHYDVINMAQYRTTQSDVASLHSPNDATSLVYFRRAESAANYLVKARLYLSAVLLRRYEKRIYGRFTKIHVVSDADREYLEKVDPALDIEVIPISSGYLHSVSNNPRSVATKTDSDRQPVIVVCGNLGDAAIARGFAEFLTKAFPRLLDTIPNLRLRVLGRAVPEDLLQHIRLYSNIDCFSWVEDYEGFITQADAVLVPDMVGAPGAKTRVVQAMALGLAVVGSRTAFEGIPAVAGVHGMIYDTLGECVSYLALILGDDRTRRNVGSAAAVLAADEFSIDRIGPRYEALYFAAVEKHFRLTGERSPRGQSENPAL